MKAVYKRELSSAFYSMIAEVFIALVLFYTGIYFTAYNLNYGYPLFSYTLSSVVMVLVVGVPLLTMRSFAEEQKNRTDQLLLTAPVPLTKIVLGKFASVCTVLLIPCLVFCLYPFMIRLGGTAYFKVDYLSILCFFLLGCVFAAVGMFISALTESQIIAYVASFGIFIVIYLWNGISGFLPTSAVGSFIGLIILWTLIAFAVYRLSGTLLFGIAAEGVGLAALIIAYVANASFFENLLPDMLSKLALVDVMADIADTNLLDVSGVVLYISVTGFFIFLTVQHIQKKRWK